MNTIDKKATIESLTQMMDSCFTYGGLDKTSYNYERYILPYKERLGEELFNEVFDNYSDYLKQNYTIERNVYTDSDGLTYNSLIKKTEQ